MLKIFIEFIDIIIFVLNGGINLNIIIFYDTLKEIPKVELLYLSDGKMEEVEKER